MVEQCKKGLGFEMLWTMDFHEKRNSFLLHLCSAAADNTSASLDRFRPSVSRDFSPNLPPPFASSSFSLAALTGHYNHCLRSSLLSRSRSDDDLNTRVKPEIQRCEFRCAFRFWIALLRIFLFFFICDLCFLSSLWLLFRDVVINRISVLLLLIVPEADWWRWRTTVAPIEGCWRWWLKMYSEMKIDGDSWSSVV